MSKRLIPKKLEEDLRNAPKYKLPDRFQENAQKALLDSERDKFSVEKLMYDEILRPSQSKRGSYKVDDGMDNDDDRSKKGGSVDSSIVLINRLTAVEADLKSTRSQLAEALMKLNVLENENEDLKLMLNSRNKNDSTEQLSNLRHENSNLHHQISEMVEFLADYGLVWVGYNHKTTHQKSQQKSSKDDLQDSSSNQHLVTFEIFQQKVLELNDLIRNEPIQIKTENGPLRRARLVHAEENVENIRVVYYRNGILVKRGPFRPCDSDLYHRFVRDIMDGFFPSEFRKDYPDGVILELRDRHTEDYVEGKSNSDDVMTANQLLNRLPKIVVRNGELIHVRDDVEARLRGSAPAADHRSSPTTFADGIGTPHTGVSSSATAVSSTSTSSSTKQTVYIDPIIAGETSAFATIQVRWISGPVTVLVVRIPVTGTVRDIYEEIRRYFGASHSTSMSPSCPNFEIRSAYPPRLLPDDMSLVEAQLIPNGTVHARQIN